MYSVCASECRCPVASPVVSDSPETGVRAASLTWVLGTEMSSERAAGAPNWWTIFPGPSRAFFFLNQEGIVGSPFKSIVMTMWFLSLRSSMWWLITFIDLCVVNRPCTSEMKPTWSWGEANWIMVGDLLDVFLNLICKYVTENVHCSSRKLVYNFPFCCYCVFIRVGTQ